MNSTGDIKQTLIRRPYWEDEEEVSKPKTSSTAVLRGTAGEISRAVSLLESDEGLSMNLGNYEKSQSCVRKDDMNNLRNFKSISETFKNKLAYSSPVRTQYLGSGDTRTKLENAFPGVDLESQIPVMGGLPGSKREFTKDLIQEVREKGIIGTVSDLVAVNLVSFGVDALLPVVAELIPPSGIVLGVGVAAKKGREYIEEHYKDKIFDFTHVDPEYGPNGAGQAYLLCSIAELPSDAVGTLASSIKGLLNDVKVLYKDFDRAWTASQEHFKVLEEKFHQSLQSNPHQSPLTHEEIETIQKEYWDQNITAESGMSYEGAKAVDSLVKELGKAVIKHFKEKKDLNLNGENYEF